MSPTYSGDGYELWHADALALPLNDFTVDLVVTSPPYFALRSYQDGGEHYDGQIGSEATPTEFIDALLAATREMMRVLKPSGSIWVNLGDKYAGSNGQSGGASRLTGATYSPDGTRTKGAKKGGYVPSVAVRSKSLMGIPWRYALRCIDELGLILRAEVIWNKPNGLPESVTDRVRRSHEHWFHFTKEPRYFSAIDEIREPHIGKPGDGISGTYSADAGRNDGGTHGSGGFVTVHPLGKLPGSVWTIATEPLIVPDELGVDHFAAFPTEWPKRIISGWAPAGICEACGEGRRPVVEKDRLGSGSPHYVKSANGQHGHKHGHADTLVTVVGHACACPNTDTPTRPAVVLDPFCGTGTTVAVARALGRHGVGTDLSRDYLRLAHWRVAGDGYRRVHAKVHGTKPIKTSSSGTLSLFDDTAA